MQKIGSNILESVQRKGVYTRNWEVGNNARKSIFYKKKSESRNLQTKNKGKSTGVENSD